MQIVAERSNLSDIYSTSSKVFIPARDRDIFLNLKVDDKINVYEFNYEQHSPSQILKLWPDNISNDLNKLKLVRMQLVPNFCLGLVTFSQAGKEELIKLTQWWSERSSPQLPVPPLIELDSNLEITVLQAEFWQQMYGRMEQSTYAVAERIATLQKQYFNLRTLHENMQNAFATVEDYLSQAKLPPLQLNFDNQPVKKLIDPTNFVDSHSPQLKQLLPLSSRGLAMVELHVVKKYDNVSGHLTVQLTACEDNSCFAKWQIPYQQLPDGWLNLDLPVIDLGRKREVELIITWYTNIGPAPALSLGQIQHIPEVQARNGETRLDRSLAFRIWTGLPGTRKVTNPYLLTIDEKDKKSIRLGYLGQGTMTTVREVTPNLPTDEYAHIQVLDNGAEILTHPRSDGTSTIAILPFCFPINANHLTATIATKHEDADIVEYAMAIIKPGTDPKTSLNSNSALAFSGWIAVEANIPRQISIQLNSKIDEPCHIVIATKLAEGSVPFCAWACWLNFFLSSQPEPEEDVKRTVEAQNTNQLIAFKTNESLSTPIRVRDASEEVSDNRFAKVQKLKDGNKIQVHPSSEGETIALLTDYLKVGTVRIKSTVCTENAQASAVEYAVAVIDQDDNVTARLAVTSPESTLAFSGWHRVEPNHPYEIDLELPYPINKNCHLVLATRLPEDGYQANAWARWLNLDSVSASARVTHDNRFNVFKPSGTFQVAAKLRDASVKKSDNGFAKVQKLKDKGQIQIHPNSEGETIGVLTDYLKVGTVGIKSTVCTENAQASAVEYAVAVIDKDNDVAARLAVTSPEFALAFSGWHRVEPNHPYEIDLELPHATDKNCHLVLATRLPEDGYQANAWARWLDFDCRFASVSKTTELAGKAF